MSVPTSVEVLLVQQIFWLQRKILEHKNDHSMLSVIYDMMLAHISYITGKNVAKEVTKPVLERNLPNEIKCERLLKSILELNIELSILLSEWIEEKRKKALLQGI